jgi:hypothetical protein
MVKLRAGLETLRTVFCWLKTVRYYLFSKFYNIEFITIVWHIKIPLQQADHVHIPRNVKWKKSSYMNLIRFYMLFKHEILFIWIMKPIHAIWGAHCSHLTCKIAMKILTWISLDLVSNDFIQYCSLFDSISGYGNHYTKKRNHFWGFPCGKKCIKNSIKNYDFHKKVWKFM